MKLSKMDVIPTSGESLKASIPKTKTLSRTIFFPAKIVNKVDFPAPLAPEVFKESKLPINYFNYLINEFIKNLPTNKQRAPLCNCKFTFSKIGDSPKLKVRSSTSTTNSSLLDMAEQR